MTDILALVQGDAGPGDALHERHRRAAVDIGAVEALLADNAEYPGRRRQSGHAGGDQRFGDFRTVGIEVELLLIDGNDDLHRTFRQHAERFLADVFGFLGLGLVPDPRRCRRCQRHRDHETERVNAAGQGASANTQSVVLVFSTQCQPPAKGTQIRTVKSYRTLKPRTTMLRPLALKLIHYGSWKTQS